MSVFEHTDFDGHEGVHFFEDENTHLKAIIAVHSTLRGPSAGGTRFWTYVNSEDALTDALRLSKAMSYKNAMADLPLGGGKAVVMRPEGEFDRDALFKTYGQCLNRLAGSYVTAEDVGMTTHDLKVIKGETPFAAGVDEGPAASGDPSPITADGVFRGLQVAVKYHLKQDTLKDIKVAVQGLGNVGYNLCKLLHSSGAKLVVTDINSDSVTKAVSELGAQAVAIDEIHSQDVDVFAPCALGGAINSKTLPEIKAKVIAGAANNQLSTPDLGDALRARGVLYCPDYVINAGGIINIAAEVSGHYDNAWVEGKLQGLQKTLVSIFERAERENKATSDIADAMAIERIYGC